MWIIYYKPIKWYIIIVINGTNWRFVKKCIQDIFSDRGGLRAGKRGIWNICNSGIFKSITYKIEAFLAKEIVYKVV